MEKKDIILDLKTNNKTGYKTKQPFFKKVYPIDHDLVILIDFTDNWNEKLYCYLNDIKSKPKCLNVNCNNCVNFSKYSKGYYKYCSINCKNTDENMIQNSKKNNLLKYGVDNPMKLTEVQNKVKGTKIERYGKENYNNLDKAKQTKNNRYGDEYYNNREKCKDTKLKKYGVSNFTNREKAKSTSLAKYGNEYYNNHEKQVKTNLKKYGCKIYNNKEKAIKTNLEKYGETCYTKTNEYKSKSYLKTINQLAKKINISPNDLEYDGINFTIKNFCTIHDNFIINRYVLKNRLNYNIENVCTICNPVSSHDSIKENELKNFIENDLKIKTQKIRIEKKEIDVFMKDYKLGLEFDGLFWHSTTNLDSNYHLNKTNICERNSIQLLHIFENEWIYKKEIVKSIIKNILGIIKNKIIANNCYIKEIDNKISENFLNENHIQGYIKGNINIGLYYNDELVSLMVFNEKRSSIGNKYEMLRFCDKINTSVIEGVDKLLDYFILTYNPKSIISFVDRRYSQGDLFYKLKFRFIEYTQPNYWYFKLKEYILYPQSKFKKNVLVKQGFDSNKTEYQIMYERKYYKIYDCGYMKFELNL